MELINEILIEVRYKLKRNGYIMKAGAARDEMVRRWNIEIEMVNETVKQVAWVKPTGSAVKINSDGSVTCNIAHWAAVILCDS